MAEMTDAELAQELASRAMHAADQADKLAQAAIMLGNREHMLAVLSEWRTRVGAAGPEHEQLAREVTMANSRLVEVERERDGLLGQIDRLERTIEELSGDDEKIPIQLRVSYAPEALRQRFDGDADLHKAVRRASAEKLIQLGERATEDPRTWDTFNEVTAELATEMFVPGGPTPSEAGPVTKRNGNGVTLENVRDAAQALARPFGVTELAKMMEKPRGTVQTYVQALAERGTLVRTGGLAGPSVRYEFAKPQGGGPASRPQ